jgi:hypothetical protein
MSFSPFPLYFVCSFVLGVSVAPAATVVWDNSDADSLWSTANNWDSDTEPTSADDLTFPAALGGSISLTSTEQALSLSFADDYTFAGGNLNLAAGNSIGNWTDTRWKAEDFKKNGWRKIEEKEMGGKLINSRDQDLRVFYKKLEAGDEGSLRCNKYGAPQFMTLPAPSK